MKAIVFSILLGSCLVPAIQAQNYVSKVWVADQGNGTYKIPCCMPIIPTPTYAGWAMTST